MTLTKTKRQKQKEALEGKVRSLMWALREEHPSASYYQIALTTAEKLRITSQGVINICNRIGIANDIRNSRILNN